MRKKKEVILAISAGECQLWGCPYCGYRSFHSWMSSGGVTSLNCAECGKLFVIFADGVKKSTIKINGSSPKFQEHPRKGIPKHGNPDKLPESGGEFFRSRGIGLDNCSCFVCGRHSRDGKRRHKDQYLNNIAAFVQCKDAGERVVAMFPKGAWLDYREYEPDRVQVKIGACDRHLRNLETLDKLCKDKIITKEKINKAIKGEK